MPREKKEERIVRMTQLERPWWEQGIYIGGVDEAGRGPLAGPVVAACVVMPEDPLLLDVNDSKKVSEKKREELFELIYKTAKAVGVGIASVEEIEAINIKNAARLAMKRAIEMAQPDRIFVDAEETLLKARVIDRRLRTGRTMEEALQLYQDSDGPNIRLCMQKHIAPDVHLVMTGDGNYKRII